jgi:Transposase DDE domain
MRMTTPITEVRMRGDDREDQQAMWSYVPMERRIPADHPLRAAALELLGALNRPGGVTLGADKGYDTRDFVAANRLLGVMPHVAQNRTHRASAIDGRTTRHPGYAVSQRRRKRVEEIFGWLKTVGLMRKTRHRGRRRVDWMFTFALAAYNLVRIRNLTAQAV